MKFSSLIFASVAILLGSCSNSKSKKNKSSNELVADTVAQVDVFNQLSPAKKKYYADKAEAAYHRILGSRFNGEILIAKDGQIVFEDYKGIADFRQKTPITPRTSLHVASITKTFTGMTVLHLWEEGKISLDDSIQQFFPKFPYHGITIKMLLSHRTGLPNYVYFMEKGFPRNKYATNQDVIDYMIANKPPITAYPDRAFQYCNTNFVILASIIEKVTGQTFPQYMKDSVFLPLGLKDTYVFSIKDTNNYVPTYRGNRPFPMTNTDCTYGDKNIYSTVRNLFKWDCSLYQHSFLKPATLKMAFTPQSHEHPSKHNYALAWRTYFNPQTGDSIIYHNGYWHGSNNVFMRLVQDTATIILLGNKYNKNNYNAKKISEIFTGKPDFGKLEE